MAEEASRARPARKRVPKQLAVIDQIGCTGCEACIAVCPVDCIELIPGPEYPELGKLCEVDLEGCIGCTLCAQHCPWDTIRMYPYEQGLQVAPKATLRSVLTPKEEGVKVP